MVIGDKEISKAIKEEAMRLGFAGCGFSKAAELAEDSERLRAWLHQDYHTQMGYMANHFDKRIDPTLLVEGAQSVISLLYNYYTDKLQHDPHAPVLSKYAYGKDYHFVMKEKMKQLFEFIKATHPGVDGRVFVDSAPVLDRAWARKAGLGWIGKNSNLISRKAGSFVFIGELIVNLELEYNEIPESDFCGSCTLCIEACPTGAILDNRSLDAERCISYQTIENKGEVSPDLEGFLSNRIFGCDICQDVCPWNRNSQHHKEPDFDPAIGLLEMTTEDWANLDQEQYNRLFRHSPVKRAGFEKLKGNLTILQKKSAL
jgi:epoxyqueuosine reductase